MLAAMGRIARLESSTTKSSISPQPMAPASSDKTATRSTLWRRAEPSKNT